MPRRSPAITKAAQESLAGRKRIAYAQLSGQGGTGGVVASDHAATGSLPGPVGGRSLWPEARENRIEQCKEAVPRQSAELPLLNVNVRSNKGDRERIVHSLLGAAWWRIQTEAFMFGFAKMPPPGTCSVRRWSLPARPRIWRRWHWRTERPEQTTRRPEAKRGSLPQNCLRRRSYPRGARSGRPAASRYWPRRNWVSTACLPAWKLPSSSARGPTASTCPD